MRRRSERKKSTDVASPAPAAVAAATTRRTSRRSRKSPSLSEAEKNTEANESQTEEQLNNRASSEERAESTRRRRNSRNRTPVKECTTPAKRKNKREPSPGVKIDVIPEEENGSTEKPEEDGVVCANVESENKDREDEIQVTTSAKDDNVASVQASPTKVEDNCMHVNVPENQPEVNERNDENEKLNLCKTANIELLMDSEVQEHQSDVISMAPEPNEEAEIEGNQNNVTEASNINEVNNIHEMSISKEVPPEMRKLDVYNADNGRTRKRRWLTKKCTESNTPILAISTDSLKNLIADVHPVPLSDVQLDSSSEVEEVVSEREEGEETPSPDRDRRNTSVEKLDKSLKRSQSKTLSVVSEQQGAVVPAPVQRSPSPAINQASNVLYITNLVRPFTVLQLKGLLARTGKILENGFWIDRIKSKCYVQYETDDEAIETRHALHGVRWPVSNPKCLNVEFGGKADMERAIQSTKDDTPKFGHDNNKDNLMVGSGWNRDRPDIEVKKISRPVREWDVGKKESLDRDKHRDLEKRRSRERATSENRENQKNDKDRKNRSRGRDPRSSSLSPVRKMKKKENDPPLRLLDDLFRKTKATPCIYWLPLTPEQIAEKEAFRQKRIEEHKERVKQKELEKGKEREKDRGRGGTDREKDREHKRNRSSDRRRSRSRDRRRY